MTLDPDRLPVRPHGQPQPASPRESLREACRTVFAWFRRRVPDEHTARDLTQTTFLRFRAWQGDDRELMPHSLEAFLLQQAEWVRRDHFRKAGRIGAGETPGGDTLDLAALEDGKLLAALQPGSRLSVIHDRIDLDRAVASLTETKRLALMLRYVDDLTTNQIARVIDRSPRRVNQLINQALEELARSKSLAGYGPLKGGHQ